MQSTREGRVHTTRRPEVVSKAAPNLEDASPFDSSMRLSLAKATIPNPVMLTNLCNPPAVSTMLADGLSKLLFHQHFQHVNTLAYKEPVFIPFNPQIRHNTIISLIHHQQLFLEFQKKNWHPEDALWNTNVNLNATKHIVTYHNFWLNIDVKHSNQWIECTTKLTPAMFQNPKP